VKTERSGPHLHDLVSVHALMITNLQEDQEDQDRVVLEVHRGLLLEVALLPLLLRLVDHKSAFLGRHDVVYIVYIVIAIGID